MNPEQGWIEPASREEAESRALQLLEDLQSIEVQLGDRNRMIENRRLGDHEYHQWRAKANRARHQKTIEYRRIRLWLRRSSASE